MIFQYTIERDANENKYPLIHIRDRNGRKRVIKHVADYKPYFYIHASEEEEAKKWSTIKKIEKGYKSAYGEELIKVFVSVPSDVPFMRDKFMKTYESDVMFVDRYAIDRLTPEDFDKEYEWRTLFLDIEVSDVTIPDVKSAKEPVVSISCYDNYTEKFVAFIWHESYEKNTVNDQEFLLEGEKYVVSVRKYSNEFEMLKEFTEFVRDVDFDLFTGWYVEKFDMTYLINRMRRLHVNERVLSPFGIVNLQERYGDVKIAGREILDLLQIYKTVNLSEMKSYQLDYVASEELGLRKVFLSKKMKGRIFNYWMNDREKLLEYNLVDVLLTVKLDKKKKLIQFIDERRKVIGCPWHSVFNSSWIVDSLLLRYGKKHKIVFPSKDYNKQSTKFKGAVVLQPEKGSHENVFCSDFSALYPSIIQTFNLSPEVTWFGKDNKPKDVDEKDVLYLGENIYTRIDKDGILPKLFKSLIELRTTYKKERNKYQKGTPEYELFDNKQTATKYVVNSIYGVMGYGGFRFYEPLCGAGTTLIGRKLIEFLREESHKIGYSVVYGDTDSIFIKKDDGTVDEYIEATKILNEKVKDYVLSFGVKENKIQLEPQYLYERFFITKAKKRYAGKLVWNEGVWLDEPQLIIKGFESKRSDTSNLTEDMQKKIFEIILSGGDEKQVRKYVETIIVDIKNEKIKVSDIALPKAIRKPLDSYKANTPWVRGAKYSNKYFGFNLGYGDKVKLIWVKKTPDGYPPTDVIAFIDGLKVPDNFEIDWDRMIDVNINMKLERIYNVFGWDYGKYLFKQKELRI